PHVSLAGGAVRGWDRRNEHYFHLIQSLSRHCGFDIETPWTELPEHVRHVLLNGSGDEAIEFSDRDAEVKSRRRHPFEGILPNLTRRYRETESQMVREELARYLGVRPCPECQGTRLNRAARHVFVADRTLPQLRDLGNTVIVVEHDEEAIREADHVIDLGPGAGAHGGHLVAQGTPREIAASPASITGQYLAGKRRIEIPGLRTAADPARQIKILGARGNNLARISVDLPLGLFTCVTGVSGSGKSTLIVDTLFGHAAARLQGARVEAAPCDGIEGLEQIDRVIDIDQSPIGRTPRSNPATYTGLFAPLRELFAAVPESRARGYDAGRFSFNVRGG